MKNINILGLLVLAFNLFGCFTKPDRIYNGPTVVEFKNHRAGYTAAVNTSILNVTNGINTRTVRQTIASDTIYVQLVGQQVEQATEVDYTIESTSTAVENTHYSIANKGKVSIPAKSSVGFIILQVRPAITIPTEIRIINFTLVGNSNVKPSENFKQFAYTIRQ